MYGHPFLSELDSLWSWVPSGCSFRVFLQGVPSGCSFRVFLCPHGCGFLHSVPSVIAPLDLRGTALLRAQVLAHVILDAEPLDEAQHD